MGVCVSSYEVIITLPKERMFHNKNLKAFCQWKPCMSYFGIILCSHVPQQSVCWESHSTPVSLLSCLRKQSLGHSNIFAFLLSGQPNSGSGFPTGADSKAQVSEGFMVTVGVQPSNYESRRKTILQFHECIGINLETLILAYIWGSASKDPHQLRMSASGAT